MMYDSLRMFLDRFCISAECSRENGMEFSLKAGLFPCLSPNHLVWITVSPNYSTLKILVIRDTELGSIESCSEIQMMQATFERVMEEVEIMACECTLQD